MSFDSFGQFDLLHNFECVPVFNRTTVSDPVDSV